MCYGKGGTEPTVTDAHLVLGRIPPGLIGGRVPLHLDAARDGIGALAADLNLSLEACAAGVLEIAAWNQANAIRQVTVRRGLDVRDFALCGFGGSGPLQACRLVDVLSLEGAVIPRDPGNVSAFGLLVVDLRHDEVQTLVGRHTELSVDRLAEAFAALEARATTALVEQGYPAAAQRLSRWADLRYEGQAFEVQAAVPGGAVTGDAFVATVLESFHDEHERLYGYCYRDRDDAVVEWVNLRVAAFGPITSPEPMEIAVGSGAVPARHRPVFFDEWIDTPIYDRDSLGANDVLDGPAIVEEFGSTTPILPGFRAEVDKLGNLVVTR
jgi:N-methylhydantoinase A